MAVTEPDGRATSGNKRAYRNWFHHSILRQTGKSFLAHYQRYRRRRLSMGKPAATTAPSSLGGIRKRQSILVRPKFMRHCPGAGQLAQTMITSASHLRLMFVVI